MCSGSSLAERDAKSEGNMATRPREYKNTTLKKKKNPGNVLTQWYGLDLGWLIFC